jgi:N-acetylglucosaminyl-diphospho-decaprenol L-rhamnosyltransferase
LATTATSAPTLSVVVVTFRHGEALRPPLEALAGQLRDGDELIVVDNASGDSTPDVAVKAAPGARVIRNEENAGFPAACNVGADGASGELLVFLNPDAVVAEGWRDAIERPARDGSGWAAWQALVTAEQGRVVNTRGGVVHFTGIAWAGGAEEPLTDAAARGTRKSALDEQTRTSSASRLGFVSGACLAISRAEFERLGGFAADFFLYHEDVDLSLRVRLAGGMLGVAADARVDHDYEFDKGPAKWRYLERNRWATLIRTYPASLLLLLAPALIATELALIVVAGTNGWLGQKLRAMAEVAGALPRLLRERRAVQATRVASAAEFARGLEPGLDSPYLGAASRSRVLEALLGGYWRLVLRLLGG